MARLKKNQVLSTIDGKSVTVMDELGSGGQGLVYKVKRDNKEYALKWYKKVQPEEFYVNLKENIEAGVPANTFLWPLMITERDSDGCFGYLMKLCPSNFKSLSQFLNNRVRFDNLSAWINAGMQITASFKILHNKGYSYQDLNDGNFFIDPKTGDVLICDNDNVAPDGRNLGILGKPRYIAPEVVDSKYRPDKYSDYYSLAVILFLLFFRGHPLEGQKDDCDLDDNESNLFCKKSLFIYDPHDTSNRPKPVVHKNVIKLWKVFPKFVRDYFIKAFDKKLISNMGLGRNDRLNEKEWLKMFRKLRNSIVTCPKCKEETFFNMKKDSYQCMGCGVNIERPPHLVIGKDLIPLQLNRRLYCYEIDQDQELDIESMNEEVGEVIENPRKPGIRGLKNTSKDTWYKYSPAGKETICKPGDTLVIIKDNKIKFGTKGEGIIA